jgi:PAS domain S-box-containing protein
MGSAAVTALKIGITPYDAASLIQRCRCPRRSAAADALRRDCGGGSERCNSILESGAERIFAIPVADAVGRSLDIIIPENLRARHWQGWAHAVETGQSRFGAGELLSVPAMTADGRRISVEFTIMMLRDGRGRVSGLAAILRDVTPRFEELRNLRLQLASRPRPAGDERASET